MAARPFAAGATARWRALILSPNALGIDVVQQDGVVLRSTRDNAHRAMATVQATLGELVVAAAPHPDVAKALVLTASGSLFLLDTETGIAETLCDALVDPIALTIDADERLAAVLGNDDAGYQLTLIELDSGIVGATVPAPPDELYTKM